MNTNQHRMEQGERDFIRAHRRVSAVAGQPHRRHNDTAALIILCIVTGLSVAVGMLVGTLVASLGWGPRPAWIVGGAASAFVWMVMVSLSATMLSSQVSRQNERQERGE